MKKHSKKTLELGKHTIFGREGGERVSQIHEKKNCECWSIFHILPPPCCWAFPEGTCISVEPHLQGDCHLCHVNHWIWGWTSLYDPSLEWSPSSSASRHIWRPPIFCFWSWRHIIQKVLLGHEKTFKMSAITVCFRVLPAWWGQRTASSWVSNNSLLPQCL